MAQIDAAIASARRAARTELTAAHPEHTAIQTLIARMIPTSSCSRDTLLTIADQHTTLPAFIAAIATRMRSESAEGYATNRDYFGTRHYTQDQVVMVVQEAKQRRNKTRSGAGAPTHCMAFTVRGQPGTARPRAPDRRTTRNGGPRRHPEVGRAQARLPRHHDDSPRCPTAEPPQQVPRCRGSTSIAPPCHLTHLA